MTPRGKLVAGWQKALAESEELCESGSPTLLWLRRMQVRLYRFLLTRYGGGDWRPETPTENNEPATHPLSVLESVEVGAGTPPKSAGRIQKTLQAVHAAGPVVPAGDYRPDRAPAEYWFPVGAVFCTNKPLLEAARQALEEHEIPHRVVRSRALYLIRTHQADQARARQIVDELRPLYTKYKRLLPEFSRDPASRSLWGAIGVVALAWFVFAGFALSMMSPKMAVLLAGVLIVAIIVVGFGIWIRMLK